MKWTHINEATPPLSDDVLFCCWLDGTFGDIHLGWWEGVWTAGDAIAMETVPGDPAWWFPCTHWMPLPTYPNSSQESGNMVQCNGPGSD